MIPSKIERDSNVTKITYDYGKGPLAATDSLTLLSPCGSTILRRALLGVAIPENEV